MTKRNLFGSTLGVYLPPMHLLCSNDSLRPAMQCVHIEDGIATATNAYALVRYDINNYLEQDVVEFLEGKLINRDAWKLMCSVPTMFIRVIDDRLVVKHFNNISDCNITIPFVDEKYPDFHAITKDVFSLELKEAKERICFNVKLLGTIAKVLSHPHSNNEIRFWFNQGGKAIVATDNANDDAVAMLMPVYYEPPVIDIDRVRKFK